LSSLARIEAGVRGDLAINFDFARSPGHGEHTPFVRIDFLVGVLYICASITVQARESSPYQGLPSSYKLVRLLPLEFVRTHCIKDFRVRRSPCVYCQSSSQKLIPSRVFECVETPSSITIRVRENSPGLRFARSGAPRKRGMLMPSFIVTFLHQASRSPSTYYDRNLSFRMIWFLFGRYLRILVF
jgi:hypothetical protein